MSQPPTEYQIGDIANGHIWTGTEWTRFYQVGDIENGYVWTGQDWVPVEDGLIQTTDPAAGQQVPTPDAPGQPSDLVPPAALGVSGVIAAANLPTATSSDFFSDDEQPVDLSFLDSAPETTSPIYKRWWFWAIAGALALVAVGAFALSNRQSDDPTPQPSSSSTPTISPSATDSTNPTGSTSPSLTTSPAASTTGTPPPNPTTGPTPTGMAQITSRYGTFTPVTKTGTGASVVDLPAGSDYGIVAASTTGTGIFAITALSKDNLPTGDLLVATSGAYSGTTAYGLVSIGAKAAKLKIDATGPWTLTISPLDKAPTLTLPANGTSSSVYVYLGPAANWTITHTPKTSTNFSVVQYAQVPNLLVNAIGSNKGTVPVSAGPTVITIDAAGPWSIAAAA